MASFINAADAIAAAVEIERRGHAFYTSVRDKAEKPKDKEFFAFMAEEEKRHEAIFLDMFKRTGGLRVPEGSSQQEYLDYLTVLLTHHSLFVPGLESRILETPLHAAMQFEKDTLLFFIELEEMVPAAEKNVVRACADEERRHLRMLGTIRHLK
ncbi:MAG: ferritin family protein [Desulfovibrio sp.]|jgi:rubrerythrin|nr:ferritin family protein [Desulfovibrio sp.]